MISVVKTKDGIIRKVLSGGSANEMKKIIGQAVRVKTPQGISKLIKREEGEYDPGFEDTYDDTDEIIRSLNSSPTKKIVSKVKYQQLYQGNISNYIKEI